MSRNSTCLVVSILLFPVTAHRSSLTAQIQDNSFLLEEAYNQEAGVVQHINTFSRSSTGAWAYSFTQEWPLGGIDHQLSYTIPLQHPGAEGTGLGDVALNYRYQLVGSPRARRLIAPRLTVLLPTGDERAGRGSGGLGLQVDLPFTVVLSSAFTAHANAGATLVPSAALGGSRATTLSQNLGASVVWAFAPKVNVLVESVWLSQETPAGEGTTARENVTFLNPGIRAAFDFGKGMQIVPGLAYTIALSGDAAEDSILVYLSVEHPFKRQ
jgi:Putative MetA-pathway of phenol degradation